MSNGSVLKRYGYLWATLLLFFASFAGHWTTAWFSYSKEQEGHGQDPVVYEYIIETSRETLENWQSEFLQLIWQVAGLSYLWYLGSPQSKEGDERKEAKIDEILRLVGKKEANKLIAKIEAKYPKK
jgi:hypothetical protein